MGESRSSVKVASLEVDAAPETLTTREHHSVSSPRKATIRYVALAVFTVSLTLSSPGRTLYSDTNVWMALVFTGLTLLLLYCLWDSNPGYIGAQSLANCSVEEKEEEKENTQGLLDTADEEQEVRINPLHDSPSIQSKRKHCNVCNVSPPLRSHHCKVCNRCVATFDHHCVFIGVCIGERNHARFLLFLIFQFLAFWFCGQVLASSQYGLVTLLRQDESIWQSLHVTLAKMIVNTLTIPAALMSVIHLFMALSNSTTFEFGKSSHLEYMRNVDATDLPFSRGICSNMAVFLQRDDWIRQTLRRSNNDPQDGQQWNPIQWSPPVAARRDSEDWWNNPWRNKYWSCC